MHGKMLIIQFSYNFKNHWKKNGTSFCGYLNQIKPSGDKKKKRCFFFLEKMFIVQFPYMKIVWLAFFRWRQQKFFKIKLKLPQNFFVFFSTANRIFYSNKHFSKNKFCMQFFFLHYVVLDTQNLDFFPFLWITFFSKWLKTPNSFAWFCMV